MKDKLQGREVINQQEVLKAFGRRNRNFVTNHILLNSVGYLNVDDKNFKFDAVLFYNITVLSLSNIVFSEAIYFQFSIILRKLTSLKVFRLEAQNKSFKIKPSIQVSTLQSLRKLSFLSLRKAYFHPIKQNRNITFYQLALLIRYNCKLDTLKYPIILSSVLALILAVGSVPQDSGFKALKTACVHADKALNLSLGVEDALTLNKQLSDTKVTFYRYKPNYEEGYW